MEKRSVRIAGHATSVSLEPAFWEALGELAARRQMSLNALLSAIDAERGGNLSSAIRLFVLASCRRGELAAAAAGAAVEVPVGAPVSRGRKAS
jgi:predicted DNA-binding ribbon-helix-helix protein